MKLIASPAFTAIIATLLGAWIHPALCLGERLPLLPPALALLLVASLVARAAPAGRAWRVLAAGAAMLLAGLGWDAMGGHVGKLELEIGEAANNFAELGSEGQPLGLRPLGFSVRLEAPDPDGGARLSTFSGDGAPRELRLAADRAASFVGVRFGRPVWAASTGATTLRLSVTTGGTTSDVVVGEGAPVHVGDLEIALEQYFPDFALDANRKPFSRSQEPRNPGALLHVRQAGREFRVFVMRALPGLHMQEGLDASFALASVEAPQVLRLAVAELPAAWLVGLGLVVSVAGLFRGAGRSLTVSEQDMLWPASACALSLCVALAFLDGARVLHWRFGAGRLEIPGAGLVLGLALLAALAAFLLLLLAALAEPGVGPRVLGLRALMLATSLSWLGMLFILSQVWGLPGEARSGLVRNLLGLALASLVGLFGVSGLLHATSRRVALLAGFTQAAPAAMGLLLVASVASAWLREGSYDAPHVRAAAGAALLGLSLLESVPFERLLWGLFLIAAWRLLLA